MIQFVIERAELERALEVLKEVSMNGFVSSQAVFTMAKTGPSISDTVAVFDDRMFRSGVILKSHPTNGAYNWGRLTNPHWHVYHDGRCLLIGGTEWNELMQKQGDTHGRSSP